MKVGEKFKMETYLAHYGILGMKWGVRRYQNYDGTYTKKGLLRYKKAEEKYADVKKRRDQGTATRKDVKTAKIAMKKEYKKLVNDNLADKGRDLYSKGHTIMDDRAKTLRTRVGVSFGTAFVGRILAEYAPYKVANLAPRALSAGGAVYNAFLSGKYYSNAKKLRAYYGHTSYRG